MNLKQAAKRLGVHYQTAYRWVRSGELVAVRIGRHYEVSEAALALFQARRAALAHAAPPPRPAGEAAGRSLAPVAAALEHVTADAGPFLWVVARHAAEVLGDGCVVRLESEDGALVPVAYGAPDRALFVLLGSALGARVWRPADVLGRGAATDLRTHLPQEEVRRWVPAPYVQFLDEYGIHSSVSTPIGVDGRPVGRLGVARVAPGRPYTAEDAEWLERLAAFARAAIERARRYEIGWARRASLKSRLEQVLAAEPGIRDGTVKERAHDWLDPGDVAKAVLDLEGCFLAANEAFGEFVGHAPDALLARCWTDITPPDALGPEEASVARLAAGELDSTDHESVRVRADGTRVDCYVHRAIVRAPDATPRFVVVVVQPAVPVPPV